MHWWVVRPGGGDRRKSTAQHSTAQLRIAYGCKVCGPHRVSCRQVGLGMRGHGPSPDGSLLVGPNAF